MINIKLSEYIQHLQSIIQEHGDLDCVNWIENDDWDSISEGYFDTYSSDGTERLSNITCTYFDNNKTKYYADINQKGYIDCQQEMVFVVNNISSVIRPLK